MFESTSRHGAADAVDSESNSNSACDNSRSGASWYVSVTVFQSSAIEEVHAGVVLVLRERETGEAGNLAALDDVARGKGRRRRDQVGNLEHRCPSMDCGPHGVDFSLPNDIDKQLVGIGGDPQHRLRKRDLEADELAPLAANLCHLQHGRAHDCPETRFR
jgi:hypothetical protein